MAINQVISSIKVDSAADDNKVPTYDAVTDTFTMETPSAGGSTTATTILATPAYPFAVIGDKAIITNTVAYCGKFFIGASITTDNLSLSCASVTASGTLKVAVFSDDGQTQYISFTTATISASGVVTTSYTGVTLTPGYYYIVVLPISTANIVLHTYTMLAKAATNLNVPSGEPCLSGVLTVTADTMPATITPTSITADATAGAMIRFDN